MRFVKPALVFVALATAVSCAKRPLAPIATPLTPTPAAEADRRAALALLRASLEVRTPRSRVRLPADGHIRLAGEGAGRYRFATPLYEYVPASTLPWIYQATGEVDVRAGKVTVAAMVAEPTPAPTVLPSTGATPVVGPVATPLEPMPKMPT